MGPIPAIALDSLQLDDKCRAPLLRIPVELRLLIYSTYYRTITLSYPFTRDEATNLLLTCRQVYSEARHEVLSNVLYDFKDDDAYYNFLSYFPALPLTTMSSLRYLSLSQSLCPDVEVEWGCPRYSYTLAAILPLLPGLQLDVLRLDDIHCSKFNREVVRDVISALITSNGFKECVYNSKDDGWLQDTTEQRIRSRLRTPGRHPSERIYDSLREPQPETWDAAIKKRDGETFGACVRLFWVDLGGERIEFRGEDDCEQLEDGYERLKGEMGLGFGIGMEIRIRRGAGVDYVQRGPPDWVEPDIVDSDEWEDVHDSMRVNEPDDALQEHARLCAVRGIKESRIKTWEHNANGRKICRSVLARQIPHLHPPAKERLRPNQSGGVDWLSLKRHLNREPFDPFLDSGSESDISL